MKRLIMQELLQWKASEKHRPLILKGARGCGKTYLLKEFGRLHYDRTACFDFKSQPGLKSIFAGNTNIPGILKELSSLAGEKIEKNTTLIIFDEIQKCPASLEILKKFYEEAPGYHVASTVSLPCTSLDLRSDQLKLIDLYPMSFNEFLNTADRSLREYVDKLSEIEKLPVSIMKRLDLHFREYLILGGMPEVIKAWKATRDYREPELVQQEILRSCEQDFAMHEPANDNLLPFWNSIPKQMARENGKFIYREVKPGAKARELEDTLRELQYTGFVYKIIKLDKPCMPPSFYIDPNCFKLYLFDTGLLRKMAGVPAESIMTDPDIYDEFKGRLVENFAMQELRFYLDSELYYWTGGNQAEVDFIIQNGDELLPLEVKSGTSVKSKSLRFYREKYHPRCGLRLSILNLHCKEGLLNIPLYLIREIQKFLAQV